MGFPSVSISRPLSDDFSASATMSQEVSLPVRLLKRLSLSIHEEGAGDCHPGPLDSVCAYIQMVCQCEVKRGCRGGESELFAHVQTSRMDEDTDGISLWWTFLLT